MAIRMDNSPKHSLKVKREKLKVNSTLTERKAQAEKRMLDNSRLGLDPVKEQVLGRDIVSAPMGIRSSEGRAFRQTKTDAKVSEYVWHDYGQGNGPELVKREKLRLEALAMVMPERQPLVQRKPRSDGKKVFADYRNGTKPFVVAKR